MYENLKILSVSDRDKPSYGSDENTKENDANLLNSIDILEETIGSFGKWQCRIVFLMSLLRIPLAWIQLNIVFIAPTVDFWCKPPEFYQNVPVEEWKSIIQLNDTYANEVSGSTSCYMMNIFHFSNSTPYIPCQWGYEYNLSEIRSSIITEWDLVCDKRILVDITQTTTMFGILLGMMVFGTAADRFGRKNVLMTAICLQILSGLISTVSPWYGVFLFFKFLSAWASSGLMTISFCIIIEVVSGSTRATAVIITLIPFGIGYSMMAVMAYYIRDWRYLQLTQFVFCFLFFGYYWLIPESPRWLLSVKRQDEAIRILEDAARVNGIDGSEISKKVKTYKQINSTNRVSLISAFKFSKLRKHALILSLKWFINGIIYFGVYQLSGTSNQNIYLSVFFVGLISIPGNLSAVIFAKKFGRRISIAVANAFTAVCLLILLFIPTNVHYYTIIETLHLGGAVYGITISYPTLHLLSGELYPTVLRNSIVALNMMCAKVGGMLAPFIVSLADSNGYFTFLVLGSTSLLEIIPLIFLPETLNAKLPESIEDAEYSE
ncbi:hypothetical protein FQA39_LY17127 [Lamprigera yunnana]|nr:hypothetical protein FQA39_LY17127 [Lamprigera yunnana]